MRSRLFFFLLFSTISLVCQKVTRPWGTYEVLSDEDNHKVKRLVVFPGKRLSLQRHQHRVEHWFIIQGSGLATLGEKQYQVKPGMSVDVHKQMVHRIQNTGQEDLIFIEVQTGTYFGEDDIERLEDDYGRV